MNANDIELEEELSVFRNSVSRFLDDVATPETLERWERNKVVDRDVWFKAGEFGMLGASIPSEYGGLGGDFRHERVIIEEIGRRGLEGWQVALHNMIVAPYLVEFGTEEQKRTWLPRAVSGETILAIAMTEAYRTYKPLLRWLASGYSRVNGAGTTSGKPRRLARQHAYRRHAPEFSPATTSPAPFSLTRQFPGQATPLPRR